MIPFCGKKYLKGGLGSLETFTIEIPCSSYKKFWHFLDEKWVKNTKITFKFHYLDLPKRVNRERRKRVLQSFIDEVLTGDFYYIIGGSNYLEPAMRGILWEWLHKYTRRKNLKKKLWLVEACENGRKLDCSKFKESFSPCSKKERQEKFENANVL